MITTKICSCYSGQHTEIKKSALYVFLIFSFFHILFLEGHINTPDGQVMFNLNRAIIERGEVGIDPLPGYNFGGIYVTENGERVLYSKFGLGLTVVSLPFTYIGHTLASLSLKSERQIFADYKDRLSILNERAASSGGHYSRTLWYNPDDENYRVSLMVYFSTWTNPLVVAGIGTLLFLIGCDLGFGREWSLFLAIAANLLTPLWHYAGEFFSEPLAAFCILGFLYSWRRYLVDHNGSSIWGFVAGLAVGSAILVKLAHIIILPWCFLYILLTIYPEKCRKKSVFLIFGNVLLGVIIPVAVILVYNAVRFGSFFETGYGTDAGKFTNPLLAGLYGLSVSAGRGMLWYNPLFLAGAYGVLLLYRKFAAECIFITGVSVTYFIFYAKWFMWEGGWCWGPRFLVPIIPLLLVTGIPSLKALWGHGRKGKWLSLFVVSASFLVAFSAVLVNYNPYNNWLRNVFGDEATALSSGGLSGYYDYMKWSWRYSPLVNAFSFPVKQIPIIASAISRPGIILAINSLVLVGFIYTFNNLARQVVLWRFSGVQSKNVSG